MPHVNKRIPDLGHQELGTEDWDTDYVVKKGATDPFKIRKHVHADLKSLLNMPAIAPLKFPFQMGWQGIETFLPKKKQYTTIELNTAKEGDFSATFKDSEDATRDALVNAGRDVILPGTGGGEPSSVTDEKKEGTQKVAEIPKGPNFTPAEERALNQVRGSVAQNKAKLKQWKWENQQHSVNGLVNNQPNNTSQETDIDYTEGPADNAQVQGKMNLDLSELDKESATRVGNMQTFMNQSSPEMKEFMKRNPAAAEDMLRDASKGIGIESKAKGPGVGDFAMVALNMLENQQKQKQQKEQADLVAARSVTGAGAGRTDKLSLPTDELGWYNYFWS